MLKRAFMRAMSGRECPTCMTRVAHAVYQRHVHECAASDAACDSEAKDDVEFVGVALSTQTFTLVGGRRLKYELPDSSHNSSTSTSTQSNSATTSVPSGSANVPSTSSTTTNSSNRTKSTTGRGGKRTRGTAQAKRGGGRGTKGSAKSASSTNSTSEATESLQSTSVKVKVEQSSQSSSTNQMYFTPANPRSVVVKAEPGVVDEYVHVGSPRRPETPTGSKRHSLNEDAHDVAKNPRRDNSHRNQHRKSPVSSDISEREEGDDVVFGLDLTTAYNVLVTRLRSLLERYDGEERPASQAVSDENLVDERTQREAGASFTAGDSSSVLRGDEAQTETSRPSDGFSSTSKEFFSSQGHLMSPEEPLLREDYRCATSSRTLAAALADNNESLPIRRVHYVLEFLWKIVLKALHYTPGDWRGESSAAPTPTTRSSRASSASLAFWGAKNVRFLLGLFTCSLESQLFFAKFFLFGRRWLPLRKMRRIASDASDEQIKEMCAELAQHGLLEEAVSMPTSSSSTNVSSIGVEEAERMDPPLAQCLRLLSAPDLAQLTRQFRLRSAANAAEALVALRAAAIAQRGLFNANIALVMRRSALRLLGALWRVSAQVFFLFDALFTVYAPIETDTAALADEPHLNLMRQLMFNLLQLKTRQLRFPGPREERVSLINIYADYDELINYVAAKHREVDLLASARRSDADADAATARICAAAVETLKSEHFKDETRMALYRALPFHLRRFTSPAVLARCVWQRAEFLQKARVYSHAVTLLYFLLDTTEIRLFISRTRIGQWYERLALIQDVHLRDRRTALDTCARGLRDADVCDVDALALQTRAQRLAARVDNGAEPTYLPQRVELVEAKEIFIEGHVVNKNLGDQRVNHFYIPAPSELGTAINVDANERSAGKTSDEFHTCSVENVVLHHFLTACNFAEGVHAEGSIWHTAFGILCYDVIFDHNVPNVWLSPIQTHPADLNAPGFFAARREAFERVFARIRQDTAYEWMYVAALKAFLDRDATAKENQSSVIATAPLLQNSEISWTLFTDLIHFLRFLQCCPPALLAAIFRRLAENYRQFRSGFPDLTVWDKANAKLAVIEVKGPKDRLSNKQRLWLDFFTRHGVETVVCYVSAKNTRRL